MLHVEGELDASRHAAIERAVTRAARVVAGGTRRQGAGSASSPWRLHLQPAYEPALGRHAVAIPAPSAAATTPGTCRSTAAIRLRCTRRPACSNWSGTGRCASIRSPSLRQHLSVPEPDIRDCVKRTLLLARAAPDTPREAVERFERATCWACVRRRYIDAIRNWAFSRADPELHPASPWRGRTSGRTTRPHPSCSPASGRHITAPPSSPTSPMRSAWRARGRAPRRALECARQRGSWKTTCSAR